MKSLCKVLILSIAFHVGQMAFAIDNVNNIGKKSKSFSTIKSDLSLGVKSGFRFQQFRITKVTFAADHIITNYHTVYQKGNITMVIPHQNRSKIFQRFKTPQR